MPGRFISKVGTQRQDLEISSAQPNHARMVFKQKGFSRKNDERTAQNSMPAGLALNLVFRSSRIRTRGLRQQSGTSNHLTVFEMAKR
jgi:hypothetical protein